jgi:hypothetical protein
MIPPFFVSVLSAAASHDQPETTTRTDSEGLCQAYDAAQRSGEDIAPLPEGMSCIPQGLDVVLTPTADVKLTELSNATVASPDSEAWIASDTVHHLQEVR